MTAITKSDREWFRQITELGCIVAKQGPYGCLGDLQRHHVLSGGRRVDHKHSICLCWGHHQSQRNDWMIVSRHPWKREFEHRYGTEAELLEKTRELIGVAA